MRLSASALAAAVILLAGCSGTMNQVNVNDDGAVQVETSDGSATAEGGSVPADWPADVPVYAGAEVAYSASANPMTGNPGLALVLTTSESAQAVNDYYAGVLVENGWLLSGTMQSPGGMIIGAAKDGRTLSMLIAEAEGSTSITIAIEAGAQ